jgi:N-methylhydantoinase A
VVTVTVKTTESTVIAVDTGGTFTDVVCLRAGALHILKVSSTPDDPAQAVLIGIQQMLSNVGSSLSQSPSPFVLIHGSTVATNAILERRGCRVALVTNRGFEDVLEIGRQTRPQLYALSGWRKEPLVSAEQRWGVAGRLDPRGQELEALAADELAGLSDRLRASDAVAVCLLHSYANAVHERAVGAALAGFDFVSLSHQVLAEYREYERCSTTVVNAYVAPLMARYLGKLEQDAGAARIRIMGSGGGAIPVSAARREPVQTVLSGPAGGVAGAVTVARQSGYDRIVTFDMGGTSTDASICPERILHTREWSIDGLPVAIPVIDIHTVGAGGGSIAWLDPGGALRVGPRSAGAQPGPICYGRGGTEVTVTDAQVWLNRLPPDAFLGGQVVLDRIAIAAPLARLARELGTEPEIAAEGVIEVVNTAMEGALRLITVERGYDPIEFTLVAFGGAAGLHAAELADRLSIPAILLPRDPGLLSAYGMLASPVRKDAARTVLMRAGSDDGKFDSTFLELERQVLAGLAEDEVQKKDATLSRWLDARYHGQSFELRVPAHDWVNGFHRAHQSRYGYAQPDAPVEAVTLRVAGTARLPELPELALQRTSARPRPVGRESVWWRGALIQAWRFARADLAAGQRITGPAVITEYSSTTWLPPGWNARVDRLGNLTASARVQPRRAGVRSQRTARGSRRKK